MGLNFGKDGYRSTYFPNHPVRMTFLFLVSTSRSYSVFLI